MPWRLDNNNRINQNTPGVTLSDGTANINSTIVSYQIPANSLIELRPTDFIALYLADTTPTEIPVGSQVKMEVTDSFGNTTISMAQGQYSEFRSFTDVTLKYFFQKTQIMQPNFYLKISATSTAAIAHAQTQFSITNKLAYQTPI